MDRKEYLGKENYWILHNYLDQILLKIEYEVDQYLQSTGLKNSCVKKTVVSAKVEPIFTYGIYLDFYEEAEMIGDKETQVGFVTVLSLHSDTDTFDIAGDVHSFYEMIPSGWFKNVDKLPTDAKIYFDSVPLIFIDVLKRFFKKEIPDRGFM